MDFALHLDASAQTWNRALLVLLDSAAKGLLLLVLAATVAWLLRRRSAASRHLLWLMALASLLLLPALSLLLPPWRLAVLPAAAVATRPHAPFVPPPALEIPPPQISTPTVDSSVAPEARPPASPPIDAAAPLPGNAPPSTEPPAPVQPVPIGLWALCAWLAGALAVICQLAIGVGVIAYRRRRALPLESDVWTSLAAGLARSLHLARPVRLLLSTGATMPIASGVLRPAILLPREALGWNGDKRRVVLLHELAHVRRWDCLTQPLAHLALALHWFNPLAWVAIRRLTAERELACDDMVLAAGARPSSYAGHLLDIARTLHATTLTSAAAVAMARRSQLEGRLRGILDAARPRCATTRRMLAAGLFIAAALVLPLAAVRLGRAQPAAQKPPAPTPAARSADPLYKPITPDLQPTSEVTGIVKDESGRPVGGVDVVAVRGWEFDDHRLTAPTDADGHFRFPELKPDGYWFFSVDDARYGWEWDHERGVTLPATPEHLPLQIALYRPRTLRGTVADEAGKPVAGVRVVLVNQKLTGRNEPVSGHIDVDFITAQTDDAGRFTMQRLRPGRADFVLEHDDYSNTFVPLQIDAKDQTAATLTIEKGLTLRGRVTHNGQPLKDVAVHVGINEAHRPMVRWKGLTDADGRFEAPHVRTLPPGVRGRAPNVAASVQDPQWQSDGYSVYQTKDGELPPLAIEVRPRQPGQAPARHVDVGKPPPPDPAGRAGAGPPGAVTVAAPATDNRTSVFLAPLAEGEYSMEDSMVAGGAASFESVPPGRYIVSAATGGGGLPPKSIEVAAGQKVSVALEPGPCGVRGVVRSGGRPVGGGFVSWFASPRIPRAVFQGGAKVQDDGSYAIEGLAPDSYQLVYDGASVLPHEFTVKVAAAATEFNIDLPTARIEGTLIGRTPKPQDPDLPGNIRLTPAGPAQLPAKSMCYTEADADGHFRINHLSPGRYTIQGYGLSTTVTVEREGAVAAATLRPPDKTGEIAGLVRGRAPAVAASASQVLYATAFARDDQGYNFKVWNHQTQVDPQSGRYRISDLPVGAYGVFVSSAGPGGGVPCVWVSNVEVREGLSRQLTIDLPPGRAVSIVTDNRLSLQRGAPACTGWRLKMPSGDWLERSLLLGNSVLPLGDYTIEAVYGDPGPVTSTFRVQAGEGPQVVTVNAPSSPPETKR